MAKYIGQLIAHENGKDELLAKTMVVDLEPNQIEAFRDKLFAETVKDHGAPALLALLTGAATIEVVPTVAVTEGAVS